MMDWQLAREAGNKWVQLITDKITSEPQWIYTAADRERCICGKIWKVAGDLFGGVAVTFPKDRPAFIPMFLQHSRMTSR